MNSTIIFALSMSLVNITAFSMDGHRTDSPEKVARRASFDKKYTSKQIEEQKKEKVSRPGNNNGSTQNSRNKTKTK